jgi:hypothetical protein
VLYDAAGLRKVLQLRQDGSRDDLVEAFRSLDRFWKIILIRQGGSEQVFWSGVLRGGSRS